MPKPLLIGISGKKRSGKDTLCQSLLNRLDNSVRVAFADQLKEEVAEACGVSLEYLEHHKANFRYILQGWGTEFRRQLTGLNYWIEQLDNCVAAWHLGSDFIIIPDVRFQNEHAYVKQNGGIMIRINRPDMVSTDTHPSETDLDSAVFDFYFDCYTVDEIDRAAASLASALNRQFASK